MKQQHQLLSQANVRVYLHQNPQDADLTLEDLKAMVGQLSAVQLIKRLR